MRNLTPASITEAFAEYAKNAPSARTLTLLVSLADHLHSFVRDNRVTFTEWMAGIDALTKAMEFTDDKRNEYILFSDLLGVSSLVDMVNAATKGTVLALWQNGGNGLYSQQDKAVSPTNYHARLTVADDGSFSYSTVRPISYTVPDDGPAGDMLRVLGREAWRPAHLHMIVQAPGRKPLITEFFPEDDKYLDRDAVFGVRAPLVLPFKRVADRAELPKNLAARDSLPLPVWTARIDLTLPAA